MKGRYALIPESRALATVGMVSSIALAALTLVTFAFAMAAVPISGANAPGGGIPYPYLDTLRQFPRDYLWQYLAMLSLADYLVAWVAVSRSVAREARVFGQIGLAFAAVAATVLLADYFVQVSVVPVSLESGETEGIALLTQYNPHGVFIALEELGYIAMALSFAALVPAFARGPRLERALAGIFASAPILCLAAFVAISARYGIDRKDRFEVIAISIDWLSLIAAGILLGAGFSRARKGLPRASAPVG